MAEYSADKWPLIERKMTRALKAEKDALHECFQSGFVFYFDFLLVIFNTSAQDKECLKIRCTSDIPSQRLT